MTSSFILLDRSGSMESKWNEVTGALNTYVEKLDPKDKVTLAVFDSGAGLQFDVLRDKVTVEDWKKITPAEAYPRGMTPLYDAVGKIAELAQAENSEKTVLVIITDGEENASKELKKDEAKALLDRLRAKNWQVVFIGADFDNFADAQALGGNFRSTAAVTKGNYNAAFASIGIKANMYSRGGQAMGFSDADKSLYTSIKGDDK